MENFEEKENKLANYIRLAFWLYLVYFTYQIVFGKLETLYTFIHNIDLPIHEFGHLFFGIISANNYLITIAGGSLAQVIFPSIMTVGFLFQRNYFATGICAVWVGESMIDVSYYISDASARDMPLITGDPDTHDWFNILSELNILHHDTKIGSFVFFLGSIVMITGLIYSFYSLNKQAKFIEVKL